MIDCTLQIHTKSETDSTFKAKARFEALERGGRVVYPVEEDEGMISFDENGMEMHRRGLCSLSAQFVWGEETQMFFSSIVGAWTLPLETKGYRMERSGDGYRLMLRYVLKGSDWIQKFQLNILIKFSEEK